MIFFFFWGGGGAYYRNFTVLDCDWFSVCLFSRELCSTHYLLVMYRNIAKGIAHALYFKCLNVFM